MPPGKNSHKPLQLPNWWPDATGQIQFPTDSSLPTSAKALRGHLDQLAAAMNGLHGDGLVTAEDVGNWDAGQAFAGTVKSAHEHIGTVYREFQRQLEGAAALLVKSHENHGEAEDVSAKAARRADDPVPTRRSAPSMD